MTNEPSLETIDYGIDGGSLGIYDGVIIWVLKDGTYVNRWFGVPGCERRSEAVEAVIEELRP